MLKIKNYCYLIIGFLSLLIILSTTINAEESIENNKSDVIVEYFYGELCDECAKITPKIDQIIGRQVLDSRGNPLVRMPTFLRRAWSTGSSITALVSILSLAST